MEEFQNVEAVLMYDRGDIRMREAGIGPVDHSLQVSRRNILDEIAHDMEGKFRVGQFGQCVEITRSELRNCFRQQQTTIFCQAHHYGLLEGDAFDLTAGTHVLHIFCSLCFCC